MRYYHHTNSEGAILTGTRTGKCYIDITMYARGKKYKNCITTHSVGYRRGPAWQALPCLWRLSVALHLEPMHSCMLTINPLRSYAVEGRQKGFAVRAVLFSICNFWI